MPYKFKEYKKMCKKQYREKHKLESQIYQKKYRETHREYFREYDKKYRKDKDLCKNFELKKINKNFGIHEYNKMLKDQKEICYICHQPEKRIQHGKIQALSVDHNHKTGEIRKLLCSNCNRGIGFLKDDPQLLRKAADYLEKYNTYLEEYNI